VEPLDRELLHVTRALCAVAAGWFLMGLPHRGECLLEQAAELLAERARVVAPTCLQELQ
jgi:hypothetical protein